MRSGPAAQEGEQQHDSERAAVPGPSGERETSSLQPGLPQYPGYLPMQSDSEERHHSVHNGDSPGNEQIPQCECILLLLDFLVFMYIDLIIFSCVHVHRL